jgi:hypothetical protein
MDTDSIQLIHELIKRQAGVTPERTAVIWRDRRLSYGELWSSSMLPSRTILKPCARGALHVRRRYYSGGQLRNALIAGFLTPGQRPGLVSFTPLA